MDSLKDALRHGETRRETRCSVYESYLSERLSAPLKIGHWPIDESLLQQQVQVHSRASNQPLLAKMDDCADRRGFCVFFVSTNPLMVAELRKYLRLREGTHALLTRPTE